MKLDLLFRAALDELIMEGLFIWASCINFFKSKATLCFDAILKIQEVLFCVGIAPPCSQNYLSQGLFSETLV